MSFPSLQDLLEAIEKGTVPDLIAAYGPTFMVLSDAVGQLCEHFHPSDQSIALALVFGMMCAAIEGEPVEVEKRWGILVTFEVRLQIFSAVARLALREGLAVRAALDTPETPKKDVM